MRSAALVLTLSTCFKATCSLALTSVSSIDGQQLPDKWNKYDLTPYNETEIASNSTVSARTDVQVCARVIAATAACLVITNILVGWVTTMGLSTKSLSDQGKCTKSYGSLDGLSWVYYATGNDCDTTAEQSTIAGAIEHHLRTTDSSRICGMECLDLTHSGTWNGYLLIGPTSTFDSSRYCGPTLSFSSCTSGGKNDLG